MADLSELIIPVKDSTTGEVTLQRFKIKDYYGGGGASALSNLTDVQLQSLDDGNVLVYDSTLEKWVNTGLATVATSGSYNDLTDKPDLSEKADVVANATNGNFAGLDADGNLTDSGSKASDFLSSNYLETSTKTTASSKDTFTFTDSAITSTASFDVYSDVFGAPIVDMVLSGNQLSVSFNSSDNVGTCRLYIK